MCHHQHHGWSEPVLCLISVPGVTAYRDSPLYVELSAILPQVLESAMGVGELRRWTLHFPPLHPTIAHLVWHFGA